METKKVAINRDYGGFHLTYEGVVKYLNKKYPNEENITVYCPTRYSVPTYYISESEEKKYIYFNDREEKELIETIEELGEKAYPVKVVEIPADVEYEITDYDGMEQIEEVHRIWS